MLTQTPACPGMAASHVCGKQRELLRLDAVETGHSAARHCGINAALGLVKSAFLHFPATPTTWEGQKGILCFKIEFLIAHELMDKQSPAYKSP